MSLLHRKKKSPEGFGENSGVLQLGLTGWQAEDLNDRNKAAGESLVVNEDTESVIKRSGIEGLKNQILKKYKAVKERLLVPLVTSILLIGGSAQGVENKSNVNSKANKPTAGDSFEHERKQIQEGNKDSVVTDKWGNQLKYDAPTGLWTLITPQFGVDYQRTTSHIARFYQPQTVARGFSEDPTVGNRVAQEGFDKQVKDLEGRVLLSTVPVLKGYNWPMPVSMEVYTGDKDNKPLIPENAVIDSITIVGFATDEGKSSESIGKPDLENKQLATVRALYGALGVGNNLLDKLGPEAVSKLVANNSEVMKDLTAEDISTAAERLGINPVEAQKVLQHIQLSSYEILSTKGDINTLADFTKSHLGIKSATDQELAHLAWREYNTIKLGGEQDSRLNDPAFKAGYENLKQVLEKRGFTIEVKYHTVEDQMVRVRVPLFVLFLPFLPPALWALNKLRKRNSDGRGDQEEKTNVPPPPPHPPFPGLAKPGSEKPSKMEGVGDGIDARIEKIGGLFRDVEIDTENPEHTKNLWLVWSEDLWRYFEDNQTKKLGADYWQMMQPVIGFMKEKGWASANQDQKEKMASKLELYLSKEIIEAWKKVDLNKRREILEAVDKDRELPRKETFEAVLSGVEAQGYTDNDLKRAKLIADELFGEYSKYTKDRMQRYQNKGEEVPLASNAGARKYKAWQTAFEKYQEILDELQSPKKSQKGLVDYSGFIKEISSTITDHTEITSAEVQKAAEKMMDEWDKADSHLTDDQKKQRRDSKSHQVAAHEFARACILIGALARQEELEGINIGNRIAARIFRDKKRLEEPTIEKDGFDRNDIEHGLDYENDPRQVLFAKYHARALVEVSGNIAILPENQQSDVNNALLIMSYRQQQAFEAYRNEQAVDNTIIRENGDIDTISKKLSSEALAAIYQDITKEQGISYENIMTQIRDELPYIIPVEDAANTVKIEAARLERTTRLILDKWDEKDLSTRQSQGEDQQQVLRELTQRRGGANHLQAAREFGAVILVVAEKLPLGATKAQVITELEKALAGSTDQNLRDMLVEKQREIIQAS